MSAISRITWEILAQAMHAACKCLMDVRYHTKTASARELFVSIMKTLWDAAIFVEVYRRKGPFGEFYFKLCVVKNS